MVGLGVTGESPGAHVSSPRSHGRHRVALDVGVATHELGGDAVFDAEQVVKHQHLTVTVRPRPDSDGGNGDRFGDHGGHFGGNPLEHQRKTAGGFEG